MHCNYFFLMKLSCLQPKISFQTPFIWSCWQEDKKRDFLCSHLRLKIGVEVCWSIHFALVHPVIMLPLLFSYLCVSSCWCHSAKLFLPLVLPEGSSHAPAYLHHCFPGILPGLLFFAILIFTLDFLLIFFLSWSHQYSFIWSPSSKIS